MCRLSERMERGVFRKLQRGEKQHTSIHKRVPWSTKETTAQWRSASDTNQNSSPLAVIAEVGSAAVLAPHR